MNHIVLDRPITEENVYEVLKNAKNPKYFQEFIDKNLKQTKKDIGASFSDDILLVSMIHLFDDLQDSILAIGTRLKDTYAFFYPVFVRECKNIEQLVEKIGTNEKSDAMSAKILPKDREEIIKISDTIKNLVKQKELTKNFIGILAKRSIPNTSILVGDELSARLLSFCGSLRRLAIMPSSTIQLLGAQKAVFRHVMSGAKSPKHGILFTHPLVRGAHPSNRGKIARILADKIVVAARVDYFKGEPIGEKLLEEVKKHV